MKGKRGDLKYDIMISLIVGLCIVGIVMFWIFQEFFTKEDIDYEVCRESLILRSTLPEKDVVLDVKSSKSYLPLKCGTRVIDIDYEDVEMAEAEIGRVVGECWYMVGRGEYEIFPGSSAIYGSISTPCMACARIHLDSEVRDFYSQEENIISVRRAMNSELADYNGVTVWDYLNPEGEIHAFTYFGGWNDEGFDVQYSSSSRFFSDRFEPKDTEIFYLPTYLNPEDGDLFVFYSEPNKKLVKNDGERIDPYMVLLQYSDFDKLSWEWSYYSTTLTKITDYLIKGGLVFTLIDAIDGKPDPDSIQVCSSIETIPA